MENKKQGYKVRKYQGPVKRYCQMLNLKNDAALIAEYRKRHSEGKVWPETLAAIREVGILEMEINYDIVIVARLSSVYIAVRHDKTCPFPVWLLENLDFQFARLRFFEVKLKHSQSGVSAEHPRCSCGHPLGLFPNVGQVKSSAEILIGAASVEVDAVDCHI